MRWLRGYSFLFLLLATCHTAVTEMTKKSVKNIKRAVDTYSYTESTPRLEENSGNFKTKVIVETIKSISPSEYISSEGFFGNGFDVNAPTSGKLLAESNSFNAFEADVTKKSTFATSIPTDPTTPTKKKSSNRYYTGATSSTGSSSSTQKSSSTQASSTNLPVPVSTAGAEIITTSLPTYQFTSRTSGSEDSATSSKASKISTTRGKSRQSAQKITKKSFRLEPRISDSKPEESGLNGYHFDAGSLNFESKHSNAQSAGGMMGLSYMRAWSPHYNFHVMLD